MVKRTKILMIDTNLYMELFKSILFNDKSDLVKLYQRYKGKLPSSEIEKGMIDGLLKALEYCDVTVTTSNFLNEEKRKKISWYQI